MSAYERLLYCLVVYKQDECSFVSLRDIKRLLEVAGWFYSQEEELFPEMDALEDKKANPFNLGDLARDEVPTAPAPPYQQTDRPTTMANMRVSAITMFFFVGIAWVVPFDVLSLRSILGLYYCT